MQNVNVRVLWEYVGYWFIFNSLLVLSTFLNTAQIDMIFYINCSIYSALSFLAFRIRRSEQFNKDVFLNIALLFGIIALSEFIGFWFPVKSSVFSAVKIYQHILIASFSLFTITFLVSKYLAPKHPPRIHYLIAGLLTICFNTINFHQFLSHNSMIHLPGFSLGLLRMHLFIGLLILVYAVKLYRKDSPTGEYLHLLMIGFFFWFLRQAIDNFSSAWNIIQFQENQYLKLVNLVFLMVILLKKLNYSLSDFGKFYEHVIYGQLQLGEIKIQRRGKNNLKFLVEWGYNFFHTPKSLPMLFVLIGSQGFFTIPFYHVLNLTVNFIFILIIFLFAVQLHQKRLSQNYILNQ